MSLSFSSPRSPIPMTSFVGWECGDNFILKPYEAAQLLHRITFVLINSQMRQNEQPGMGLEIVFSGQKHFITADRLQILNLLLSTYEAAMQRNAELVSTRDALRQTNQELQQVTIELEDRVLARTRELELSNEALRQAQQVLIQQERLRALGQMASGIAHDINNAISPIALVYRIAPGARDQLEFRGARSLGDHPTRHRRCGPDGGTYAGVLPPARAGTGSDGCLPEQRVQQVVELTRARWSDLPQRRGIMIDLKPTLASELPDIRGADNEIRDALTNLVFNAVTRCRWRVIEVRTSTRSITTKGGAPTAERVPGSKRHGRRHERRDAARCLEPFSPPRANAAPDWVWRWCMGWHNGTVARSRSTASRAAGTTIRLVFRSAPRHRPPPLRSPRRRPRLATCAYWSWTTIRS